MPGDERRLVATLAKGDPEAWEQFLRSFGPIIYRSARAVLSRAGGRPEAEDVAQRVLTALTEDNYRLLRSFEGRSSLSTWLIGITRRQALMAVRSEKRRIPAPAANQRSLLEDLERAEERKGLDEAVARLNPRERLLIALYYYDELSYEDIASTLGVSLNSVSPLLRRLRDRLREALVKAEERFGQVYETRTPKQLTEDDETG